MIKVEKIDIKDCSIRSDAPIKVTTCGNVIETMAMDKVNRKGPTITQLGDYKYYLPEDVDFETGEIKNIREFNRTDNRGQNTFGIAQSMKAVRDLINCNVTDPDFVRWMTFTYAENMTDTKRLYTDRGAFWKRVIRWHKKNNIPVPEYIAVVEPQGRGAWHLHELWLYPSKAPYLPNDVIADLWQQGFVTVKKLDNVDNVGAYITAYLCDVPMDEGDRLGINTKNLKPWQIKEAEIKQEDGSTVKKKYIKGARLNLYPNKMNFYRTSRGVKRPEVEWLKADKVKEKVKAGTLTYSKAIRLSDCDGDFTSDIKYEYYNTLRGKSQDNTD